MANRIEKMKEEFYKFLVEEGVLFQFLENLNRDKYKTIEDLCNSTAPSNYLMTAFSWLNTKEGQSFWSKLHYKWDNMVDEINSK